MANGNKKIFLSDAISKIAFQIVKASMNIKSNIEHLSSNSTDSICAVIVAYNPDNKLLESINILKNQVKEIVVLDNCSTEVSSLQIINEVEKIGSVHLIRNNYNSGIATALNTGIIKSIERGHLWTLQMDQDSLPQPDMVETICAVVEICGNSNIGMIGINYSVNNTPLIKSNNQNNLYKNVLTLITSGTLISNKAFLKTGNYRDDFFIDSVDFEYCLRLQLNGFKCLLTTSIGMAHQIGSLKYKSILGFRLKSTNHPPIRRFYIARNNILLTRLYLRNFPGWILKKNFFFLVSLILMLLIDDDRKAKIKAVMKGIKEGVTYKSAR